MEFHLVQIPFHRMQKTSEEQALSTCELSTVANLQGGMCPPPPIMGVFPRGSGGGGRPPWSLRKQSFRAVSGQIKCIFRAKWPSGLLEIHLDNLKAIRSGGLKQLPGPSLQVSRLHFQGKFPPAPLPRRRPVRLCWSLMQVKFLENCNDALYSWRSVCVVETNVSQ